MAAKKAKKKAGKKVSGRTSAPSKKASAKKKPAARKASAKKAAPKKAARKKASPKKAAPKKAAPKKAAAPKKKPLRRLPSERTTVDLGPSVLDTEKTPVKTAIPAAALAPSTRPPQPQGSDRREYLRVPYGAWVTVLRQGRQTFCLARDISAGGIFLKAADPPALGEEVKMVVVIENDSTPLEMSGFVVRRSESEQGFGVRFMGVDALAARRLRDLVADASAGLWRPPHTGEHQTPRDDS